MRGSIADSCAGVDEGRIARRQLLQSLAAVLALPAVALAQGGAAQRDAPPLALPFEPTGWRTAWLDHLSYHCVDYRKAAAFYATLMGWKVRSDDGRQCTLDIGESSGGIVIRGGLTASPVRALLDGFAWGITPWDAGKVQAALEQRGLNPVADNVGSDYRSFRIRDPDGFSLAITNGTRELRRRTPANGKLPAPAPFAPTGWKTLYLDHISFEVADYRRSAAFYQALLGWEIRTGDEGQLTVQIGNVAGAIIRPHAAAAPARSAPRGVTARIGHVCFGIGNWDTERVRAELQRRDVTYIDPDGQHEPWPDMAGTLQSFHVPDAMGWDLQIGNRIAPAD